MKMRELFTCSLILFFAACSSKNQKHADEIKNLYKQKKVTEALNLLKANSDYQNPQNQILNWWQEGLLLQASGDFLQSSEVFHRAEQRLDELYTKSITERVSYYLASDSAKTYVGELFERSLMHFYQALNFYQLHVQTGQNNYLQSARAKMLKWDSFWKENYANDEVKSFFRMDIMAKIFASSIHILQGTRQDKDIAKKLLKDAKKVLEEVWPAYPSINQQFQEFRKNKNLTHKPIKATKHYEQLLNHIHLMEESLTASNQYLYLYLSHNFIAKKVAREYGFDLANARSNNAEGFALSALTLFAASVLNFNSGYAAYGATQLALSGASFGFELPQVTAAPQAPPVTVSLLGQDYPLSLISPLGEIFQEIVEQTSANTYLAVGTRLSAKYLAAIATAYAAYTGASSLGKKNSNNETSFLAKTLALATFAVASRAIRSSETADLRHINIFPGQIYGAVIKVPTHVAGQKVHFIFKNNQVGTSNSVEASLSGVKNASQLFHYHWIEE